MMTAREAYSQASQQRPTEAGLQRALTPARTSFPLPAGKVLTKGRAKKKPQFPQPHTTFSPHSRKAAQVPSLWGVGKASSFVYHLMNTGYVPRPRLGSEGCKTNQMELPSSRTFPMWCMSRQCEVQGSDVQGG